MSDTDVKPDDYYDLYSRQFFTFGATAMNKIGKANIFLYGLGGVGVEIAKNLALAGIQRLTLADVAPVSLSDLSTQYYLSEGDIGRNRAEVSLPQVTELNPYVTIDLYLDDLSTDFAVFDAYDCVILTETPLALQIEINEYVRAKGIRFLSVDSYGVFGWAFADFGDEFSVYDGNGEPEADIFVASITQEEQAEVTVIEGHRHDFSVGDYIRFTELVGMDPLNFVEGENEVYCQVVDSSKGQSFRINIDTTEMPTYVSGGLAIEKKQTVEHQFKSLQQSLVEPEFLIFDFGKWTRPAELHVAMQALNQFRDQRGELPQSWSEDDADALVEIANEINGATEQPIELDEDVVRKLAYTSRGKIIPLTAVLGGHIAQEAIKAVTGKYTPLKQWLYADAVEVVNVKDDHTIDGNRYDSQIICVGRETHQKLLDANIFMIGCGAIGCEMMKNYAMLGVSAGSGNITVADNDLIEKSNLNRQFLFRDKDLQTSKSETAANAVLDINPELNIDAYFDKICPDSEEKYNDEFIQSRNLVVNALDNLQARLYVDSRCVSNGKPLLESGTMGTKGHVQVILPQLTESYASRVDPPETGVPYCTIKSFPSSINHCIEWARDKFENLFVSKPRELEKFNKDRAAYISSLRGVAGPTIQVLKYVVKYSRNPPVDFDDCIRLGRKRFEKYYRNSVLQLLHAFPPDLKKKDGTLFWTLPKRPPTGLEFDPVNPLHYDFVTCFAFLYAKIFKIDYNADEVTIERVGAVAAETDLPVFEPKTKTYVTDENVTGEDAAKVEVDDDTTDVFESYCRELEQLAEVLEDREFDIEEFEKDDDYNNHILFIHTCANLRGTSYGIQNNDRMETKRIAGKIIPAIATTTAVIAGLVSLEFIKVVKGDWDVEEFKNSFINLGLPSYAISEPGPPEKIHITGDAYYNIWDKWEIKDQPEMTIKQFCKQWEEKLKLKVTGIFRDISMVYVSVLPNHRSRLKKPLKKYLKNLTEDYVDLIVTFVGEDGQDVNGPTVRFWVN